MHVFLETEHLVLRRFTEDDVDELVALDGDPEVMRYVTGGRPTSREEMRDGSRRSCPPSSVTTSVTPGSASGQ